MSAPRIVAVDGVLLELPDRRTYNGFRMIPRAGFNCALWTAAPVELRREASNDGAAG